MDSKRTSHIPNPAGYAERIGLEWPLTPDLETLDRIIYSHQCHVPFENLQCFDFGETPSTDLEDLYDKIVTRGRGGYCFELNAALGAFLLDCGYEVWPISCCILQGRDYIPPMLHRASIVKLDGEEYYCDVGYGGPQPAGPVPLGGRRTIRGETFFVEKGEGPWWNLDRMTSRGTRERIIGFWDIPMAETYFVPYNHYCSNSPASVFKQKRLLNIRTSHGSVAITNSTMTEHHGNEVTSTHFSTMTELAAAIHSRFGIRIDAGDLKVVE